ncbi:unnamed protein product [Symbiodinium microadriaticum]|nr:unnamed protein product [Symbiodinium microadriaticum]
MWQVAVSIIDELADRLREKVTAYLSQHTVPQDINSFDDLLVQYLQSEELQHDMENARDLMLAYVQQRMGDGGNDDHGYN